ncbi:DUF2306 domain-containing protein [Aliikangiella sp. G2MR2-5]|uniref:DUF2306 domain-containing protein n=1 Tax=Aliikangiella sp. G2MR2-5 TaxID=2788943 RepID=UPI0018AA4513|nr:DUF2306 domain-containing protein [Aliikangiella sp. G2MR2-5]
MEVTPSSDLLANSLYDQKRVRLFKRAAKIIKVLLFCVSVLLSIIVAAYAIALPFQEPVGSLQSRLAALPPVFFWSHVFAGAIASLLVPFQILTINKRIGWHRLAGKLYVCSVMLSAMGGYYMAWNAYGGLSSTIALTLLATLWWLSTLIAVMAIFQGNVAKHKIWMIRSMALTTAAITLRLLSPIFSFWLEPETAQISLYWSCWIINGLAVEIWFYIRRNHRASNRVLASG